MLQIVLTRKRKPIFDIWRCSAENGGHGVEFLDNSVDRFLGIRSTNSAMLAVLWSFAYDSHSNAWNTDTQSCTTLLPSPLDLHEHSSAQMCWIKYIKSLFVTGPIGTWIGSALHLLAVLHHKRIPINNTLFKVSFVK